MNQPDPVNQHKPRRLWPWVVSAVVLCLFAAGFSFWWPMYEANVLVQAVKGRQGFFEHAKPGSAWQKVFGTRIHPWFHEIYWIHSNSLNDRELGALSRLRTIHTLDLNLSGNSAAAIRGLGRLQGVSELHLKGRGQVLPLDWVRSLPKVEDVSIGAIEITSESWEGLVSSPAKSLTISNCAVEMTPLSTPSLRLLNLSRVNLNETHGAAIRQLRLKSLSLLDCTTTPGFWSSLSKHGTLERLYLSNINADEHTMNAISTMPSLRQLTFDNHVDPHESLSGRQIRELGRLTTLEYLGLTGYELPDDDCWAAIAKLPKLKNLNLRNCPIGDAAAQELAQSSSLENLSLQFTKISDEGLMTLIRIRSLQSVSLPNDKLTEDALQRLKAARPDVSFGR